MYEILDNFMHLTNLTQFLKLLGLKAKLNVTSPIAMVINNRLQLEYQNQLIKESLERSQKLYDSWNKKV